MDILGIQIPETGLFIAFEFLIIKENEYLFDYFDKDLSKKNKRAGYMPALGTFPTAIPLNSWCYREGKWEKDQGKKPEEMNKKDKNYCLAIELTLTN